MLPLVPPSVEKLEKLELGCHKSWHLLERLDRLELVLPLVLPSVEAGQVGTMLLLVLSSMGEALWAGTSTATVRPPIGKAEWAGV